MPSPFDDEPTGDEPQQEPADPNPDAIVKFGWRKITAREKKSAIPELINDIIGAADAIARRAQTGSLSREEAYLLRSIINSPLLSHPDALTTIVRKLGLKTVEKTKGRGQGLLPTDPLKSTFKMVKPGQ